MHLVEIFLPLADNDGRAFEPAEFERVAAQLTEAFGGLTAFTRAPAEGVWRGGGGTDRDEIVIFEVMTDRLDRPWWQSFRQDLETRFRQHSVLIRASTVETL